MDLIQTALYPGLPRLETLSYSCTHGITPGEIRVTTFPGPAGDDITPDRVGTFLLSDGRFTVPIRGVKFDGVEGEFSTGSGTTYILKFLDRRWKWRNQSGGLGGINGRYNQRDTRGKLKPWSIRSPVELCRLLLNEMGERNFVIDVPQGINRQAGQNLDRFLRAGENFPMTRANPESVWDRTPPAEALAILCDFFGCRVVYQPVSDRVLITPLGSGDVRLPDWPYEMVAAGIDDPETPEAVGVVGAPIRVQARFALEPVGEEWDGSYLPIDQLSYAPFFSEGKRKKLELRYSGPAGPSPTSYTVEVNLKWTEGKGKDAETKTAYLGDSDTTAGTLATDRITAMAEQANAAAGGQITATAIGQKIVFEAKEVGQDFELEGRQFWGFPGDPPDDLAAAWTVHLLQKMEEPGRSWRGCPPPHFRSVVASSALGPEGTPRLSFSEAVALAQKSVFRCFRVMLADPHTRKPPLKLPWFGKVDRLSQLVIQPTKVEQVVPQPRIAVGANKGQLGAINGNAGVLPEFYNGYSRDRAATVTGAVWRKLPGTQINWYLVKTGQQKVELRYTGPAGPTPTSYTVKVTLTWTDEKGTGRVAYLGDDDATAGRMATDRTTAIAAAATAAAGKYVTAEAIGQKVVFTANPHPSTVGAFFDFGVSVESFWGLGGTRPADLGEKWKVSTLTPAGTSAELVNNTRPTDRVWLGFSVTQTPTGDHLVVFNDYVTAVDHSGAAAGIAYVRYPELTLETGCLVTDAETDQLIRFERTMPLSGGIAPIEWHRAEELQVGYVGVYRDEDEVPGSAGVPGTPASLNIAGGFVPAPGDLEYAEPAAVDYLFQHARKYRTKPTEHRRYIGLLPANPTGTVQQVTWDIGGGGTTQLGVNTEFGVQVVPYPVRRRAESLPPDKAAALANFAERDLWRRLAQPPGDRNAR